MRVPSRPAHHNLFLARHCCRCATLVGVGKGIQQPNDEQEAANTAQDDADYHAWLGAREIIVGGYYALLYDCLLSLSHLRRTRRILRYGCKVNGRFAWEKAVAPECARRDIAQLRNRIEQFGYCRHGENCRATPDCALSSSRVV